jgi:hypothetical protein
LEETLWKLEVLFGFLPATRTLVVTLVLLRVKATVAKVAVFRLSPARASRAQAGPFLLVPLMALLLGLCLFPLALLAVDPLDLSALTVVLRPVAKLAASLLLLVRELVDLARWHLRVAK